MMMHSNADEQPIVKIEIEETDVENILMVEELVEVIDVNDNGEDIAGTRTESQKIEGENELWFIEESYVNVKPENDTDANYINENQVAHDTNFFSPLTSGTNDETENDSTAVCDSNIEVQNYDLSNISEVFTFDQRGTTTRWMSNSTEKGWRYECTECNFRVTEQKPFLIHMSFHSGNRTCHLCSEKFETVFAQRTHLKHTHSLVKWNCSTCDFKSENYLEFKRHRFVHEDDVIRSVKIDDGKFKKIGNVYRCEECRYDVADLNRYLWHLTLHKNNTVCYFCHEIFSSRKNLPRHLRLRHSQFDFDVTRSCRKSDDDSDAEDVERFKCETCGITTRYRSSLQRHILIHTRKKEKSVPCPHCGKCFWARAHLTTHIKRVHQNMIRKRKGIELHEFLCDNCDFKCCSKMKMITHVRSHMSKKKYECGWCEYSCADVSGMHKHVRIHTGEKPYACTVCPYRTRDPTHLKKHYAVHKIKK